MAGRSYREWAEALVGYSLQPRQWERNNVSGAIETVINGGENFVFFEARFRERIDRLRARIDAEDSKHLLERLAAIGSTKWFGCFAELTAWDFFSELPFGLRVEVAPPGPQLGCNPAQLDGMLPHLGGLHFDVKIFGDTTKAILEAIEDETSERHPGVSLSFNYPEDFADEQIANERKVILGGIDFAILDGKGAYRNEKLGLTVRIHNPRPQVVVSEHGYNPYRQAARRRFAVLGDAHQFLRDGKNVLVYVVHPWFNFRNAIDFGGSQEVCFRALARRVFVELTKDRQLLKSAASAKKCPASLAVLEAAQRLSGIIFLVDYTVAPPRDRGESIPYDPATPLGVVEAFIYANPNVLASSDARHELERITENAVAIVRGYDDFAHDNY